MIVVTSDCSYPIVFTVTNTGGNMLTPQDYTIVDGSSNPVDSGSFKLAANGQTQFTLTGLDPYAGYTFSSDGGFLTFTQTQNCNRPVIVVTSDCSYPIVFTVTNTGGNMLLDQDYTIVDGSSNPVDSGSFKLAANGQTQFTLTGLDPYAGYTFSSDGGFLTFTQTQNCNRPVIVVTSDCSYPIVFTVTNTGGNMLTPQDYTIVDGSSNPVDSGSFKLAANGQTQFTLTGLDPYAGYTFSSDGGFLTFTQTQNCTRPQLEPMTACAAVVEFVVTNNGGKMLTEQAYEVLDQDGTPVVSDTLLLDVGANITITVPNANPYQKYTLQTDGFAGTLEFAHLCDAPVFVISTTCINPAHFTVTNVGGDMLVEHSFKLLWNTSQDLTPINNTFKLLKNEQITVGAPGNLDLSLGLTFVTDDLGIEATQSFTCIIPAGEATPEPTSSPEITGQFSGFGLQRARHQLE